MQRPAPRVTGERRPPRGVLVPCPGPVALSGPAVIEQLDCTILIPPGDRVTGMADGNLMIEIGGAA